MTKVCVVGAGGAIGSRLVQSLVENQYQVTGLVRNLSSAVRIGRFPVAIKVVDLLSISVAELRNIVDGHDVVVDCTYSAASDVETSIKQSTLMAETLVSACSAADVSSLIHYGSLAVYPVESSSVDESTVCRFSGDAYGDGKLAAEEVILKAGSAELNTVVLQLPIVMGPYLGWTISPVSQLKGCTLVMPDDIRGACNVIFIDDVITATVAVMNKTWTRPEKILLNSQSSLSWTDFYVAHAAISTTSAVKLVSREAFQVLVKQRQLTQQPWIRLRHSFAENADLRQLILQQWGIRTVYRLVKKFSGQSALDNIKARIVSDKENKEAHQERLLAVHLLSLFDNAPKISSNKAHDLLKFTPQVDFETAMKINTQWLRWANLIS